MFTAAMPTDLRGVNPPGARRGDRGDLMPCHEALLPASAGARSARHSDPGGGYPITMRLATLYGNERAGPHAHVMGVTCVCWRWEVCWEVR